MGIQGASELAPGQDSPRSVPQVVRGQSLLDESEDFDDERGVAVLGEKDFLVVGDLPQVAGRWPCSCSRTIEVSLRSGIWSWMTSRSVEWDLSDSPGIGIADRQVHDDCPAEKLSLSQLSGLWVHDWVEVGG